MSLTTLLLTIIRNLQEIKTATTQVDEFKAAAERAGASEQLLAAEKSRTADLEGVVAGLRHAEIMCVVAQSIILDCMFKGSLL